MSTLGFVVYSVLFTGLASLLVFVLTLFLAAEVNGKGSANTKAVACLEAAHLGPSAGIVVVLVGAVVHFNRSDGYAPLLWFGAWLVAAGLWVPLCYGLARHLYKRRF